MLDATRYERIVVDRYRFRGFHGCDAWCALEILKGKDGGTVVIATEVKDNPGTSNQRLRGPRVLGLRRVLDRSVAIGLDRALRLPGAGRDESASPDVRSCDVRDLAAGTRRRVCAANVASDAK